METRSGSLNNRTPTLKSIIDTLEAKSKGGGYIYRGEPKRYEKVSSSLYREFGIEEKGFDIEIIQREMLNAAKKHTRQLPQDFRMDLGEIMNPDRQNTGTSVDSEILEELQHYGGKTNLIDFTTDYLIALFFACDGHPNEDGRVILQKIDGIKDARIHPPQNPRHRVIAQKSVFVRPRKGFLEPDTHDIITVPKHLKQEVLDHLRDYHGIFTETIYNDLHGFITHQDRHGDAYTEFYRGFACKDRADKTIVSDEKQKEYTNAISHYTRSLNMKPDDAETYNNRGITYAEIGDWENAIQDLTRAIQLEPNDPEVYYNRGTAYDKTGDLENAIQDLTRAIQLKPDYAEAYCNRGIVYSEKSDWENAFQDYNTAIQLKPDYAEAYCNRGITYGRTGGVEVAIQDYTKAIELKPDYAEAYNGRGGAYGAKCDWEHAIQDYNTAIQLKPDPIAYNNRGGAYAAEGDWERAIQDFTRAIQLKPDVPEAHYNRGVAYGAKCDWEHAIQDYNTAIQLKPNYVEAYYRRGECLLRFQKWDKAREDLTFAKKKGGNIITWFREDYASVADFEEKIGIQLPKDIIALLTPPQLV